MESSDAYDKLNRITQKSYSDSTPNAAYFYDAGTNGIGHRTSMTDGSGSTSWTYDPMGRLSKETKTIGTQTKTPINNSYNLDGSLSSMTYPGGSAFNFVVLGDGRPVSEINPDHNVNYIQNVVYAPTGEITSALYGQASGYGASHKRTNTIAVCSRFH